LELSGKWLKSGGIREIAILVSCDRFCENWIILAGFSGFFHREMSVLGSCPIGNFEFEGD